MKVLIILLLTLMTCSSCAALPAEERAFAVALCVEKDEGWHVHGRIPTYQSGGGYMTVSGEGESFPSALAAMDAASPMRINLSQLRLLIADVKLAQNGELSALMTTLAERPDIRMQCAVALSDAPAKDVAEALVPAAGARLSKALDLMLDARIEQGTILPAALSNVLRAGDRQSPVLIALTLEAQQIALSGGYTMDGMQLDQDEIALLSLLQGKATSQRLTLAGDAADVRDASAKIRLSQDLTHARVELTLQAVSSTCTEEAAEQALAENILALLSRLSAAGCDALGLGRQAVMQTHEMAQWHALNWPQRYRGIRWEVAVRVNGPA